MASLELLRVSHNVEGRVIRIGEGVQGVGDTVQEVDERVQDVRDAVQDVGDGVQDVQELVQGLGDKVDQGNRESSPSPIALTLQTPQFWQGTTSEDAFGFGSLLQTHPLIITLHATLNTRDQLNGSLVAPFSPNGDPLVHSCGYMENVRPFYSYAVSFDHLQSNSGLWKERTLVRPPLSLSAFRDLYGHPVPQSFKIS